MEYIKLEKYFEKKEQKKDRKEYRREDKKDKEVWFTLWIYKGKKGERSYSAGGCREYMVRKYGNNKHIDRQYMMKQIIFK